MYIVYSFVYIVVWNIKSTVAIVHHFFFLFFFNWQGVVDEAAIFFPHIAKHGAFAEAVVNTVCHLVCRAKPRLSQQTWRAEEWTGIGPWAARSECKWNETLVVQLTCCAYQSMHAPRSKSAVSWPRACDRCTVILRLHWLSAATWRFKWHGGARIGEGRSVWRRLPFIFWYIFFNFFMNVTVCIIFTIEIWLKVTYMQYVL